MEILKYALTMTYYPPFSLKGDAVHVQPLANELATKGHEDLKLSVLDAYAVKKGISELISHFLADECNSDKVLKVVEPGAQERMLGRKLNESEHQDRAHLIGSQHCDKLFTLHLEAAALALPSRSPENSPLACLEALCGGTLVVGIRINGILDMLRWSQRSCLSTRGIFIR